jgi:hypothetical protein
MRGGVWRHRNPPDRQTQEVAMNTATARRRARLAIVALLAACAAPAFAQDDGLPSLPAVEATGFVADCARPGLPSQRQVGDWTGLHNPGQVYAARERLMADIGRACRRPGAAGVQVLAAVDARRHPDRRVAIEVLAPR